MYLYILGRRHCGSTILDILLGNGPEIQSIGELVHVWDAEGACSCGTRIGECTFWNRVREEVGLEDEAWRRWTRTAFEQAHLRRYLSTWRARSDDPGLRDLAAFTERLAAAIVAVSGKPHLLDSTKEATRGLFLAKFLPGVRMIHMVRDPRSNIASQYWRWKKQGYFRFLRRDWRARPLGPLFMALAAAGWTVGNALSAIAVRRIGERAIRVRYEDLCRDPAGELRRIGEAFAIDLEPVIARLRAGEDFAVGHNVGGNQIRFEGRLRFDPERERRRPPLPVWLRFTVTALCWPLMLAYGYPLSGTGSSQRPAPQSA